MPQTISRLLRVDRATLTTRVPLFLVLILVLVLLPMRRTALAASAESTSYPTHYADILYSRDEDLFRFVRNIGWGISFMSENPKKNPLLAKHRVDKIVEEVSTLLDMRPPGLHFSIRIYHYRAELTAAYRGLGILGDTPTAFYNHGTRTISVFFKDITDRILAHEIAHAIICNYFVTPPPMKMQEILAQYVDKHLRDE